MEVRWTAPAANDLERIAERIAGDDPRAASRVARILYERCMGLDLFPHRGRKGRIDGTRELVTAPLPYIVVYRVTELAVEILRIYHSAQNWP